MVEQLQENEVGVEGQVAVLLVGGDQTRETVTWSCQELARTISRILEHYPYADVLVDASHIRSQNLGARIAARQFISSLNFRKAAIFGAPRIIKQVVRLVIKGSGRADTMGYFNSELEARSWLNEGGDSARS